MHKKLGWLVGICFFVCVPARASLIEVFAKGSISKNYMDQNNFILSVSGVGGIAFHLLPRLRLEGRYTNTSSLQNTLVINGVATLTDFLTETAIYSIGIDFDVLGQGSWFQPFLYVGVGYVETQRNYYLTPWGSSTATYVPEPARTGISGNLGAGFRVAVTKYISFEIEAFAYGMNIDQPNPLINVFGSAGIRFFL